MRNSAAVFTMTWTLTAFITLFCVSYASPWTGTAKAANSAISPQLVINGLVFQSAQPLYLGGHDKETLYAPVRSVLIYLGFDVRWNDADQAIVAAKADLTIQHKPGSSTWIINGYIFNFEDYSNVSADGTVWMPVRPLASALGYRTVWSSLSQTLYLKPDLATWVSDSLNGNNGALSYEGELVGNQRQGKGKLLLDGVLWYEGDFALNKPDGLGQLYENGRLVFEGRFENGLPNGKGIYYYPDGTRYNGDFAKGRQTGSGQWFGSNQKLLYSGDWMNGAMEGSGQFFDAKGNTLYSGQVKQNRKEGFGVAYDQDGKKIYEGEWKNGVRSGAGKAYTPQGKLLYDGQWLDDHRNGTGRTYSVGSIDWVIYDNAKGYTKKNQPTTVIKEVKYQNDKLLLEGKNYSYQGEMLDDGTPNGKGTLYLHTGETSNTSYGITSNYKMVYEGDFHLGQQTGYGKLYDEQQRLTYDGQLDNGKRQGKGIAYENGVLVYEGDWYNDRENGLGKKYVYDADFPGGSFTGQGTATIEEGMYKEGTLVEHRAMYKFHVAFVKGVANGYGAVMLMHDYVNQDGPKSLDRSSETGWLVYDGQFKNGIREGQGKLYEKNILVYEGSFVKGLREGTGKAYFNNNMVYEGPFADDNKNGLGRIYDVSTRVLLFEGEFKEDKKNGYGKLYGSNGILLYEGEFKNDLKEGFGKLYFSDGLTVYYQGEFREDQTHSDYLLTH